MVMKTLNSRINKSRCMIDSFFLVYRNVKLQNDKFCIHDSISILSGKKSVLDRYPDSPVSDERQKRNRTHLLFTFLKIPNVLNSIFIDDVYHEKDS